jgi:transcriptional regulator GlxA family with amidase domain
MSDANQPKIPAYLLAVKSHIERNFNQPLNVSELATLAGTSESTLQHNFPDAFGRSMQEYQTEIRINKAKHLLENSTYSIKSIAFQVGYKNAASFAHAFKKITGKKPSDFKKGKPLA